MSFDLRYASHPGHMRADAPLSRHHAGSTGPVADIEAAAELGFAGVQDVWVAARPRPSARARRRPGGAGVMRAVRIDRVGGPEVVVHGEMPIPVARPGEIVVKLACSDINFMDVHTRQSKYATISTRSNRAKPVRCSSSGRAFADHIGSDLQRRASDIFAGLIEGWLTVEPSGRYGFDDVEQALAELSDRTTIGKPLLIPNQPAATSGSDHSRSILEISR